MNQTFEVLLINMPFGALYRPSIGLSLLKASLTAIGISAKVAHYPALMANRIGVEFYVQLVNQDPGPSELAGEWVFAEALWKNSTSGYVNEILHSASKSFIKYLWGARAVSEMFLQECLANVLSRSPKIVAFTSVYHQQIASLALAQRIKKSAPEIAIILGGNNCEGIMGAEVARQFAFIDAVVNGEGDVVFPELVRRILRNQDFSNLPGVYTAENAAKAFDAGNFPRPQSVSRMDFLPYPDYDDFFEDLRNADLLDQYQSQILFETARGCWWGERSHCTFCGISSENMKYRSKSQKRALREIVHLSSRYPNHPVTVVDNILDMHYFKEFVPELARRKMKLELFYETKANLKKEQVALMHQAGFTSVQPGIESFSNQVLALMGKGIKAVQNIQVLKWFKEFRIKPYWNLIWGFPGEDPQEYYRMAKFLPLLTHLPSPYSASRIRLDRFSPNFEFAEQKGFCDVQPYPAYSYIYQIPPENIRNLAYFFTYKTDPNIAIYTAPLQEEIIEWWKNQENSDLFFIDRNGQLLIWDFRPVARQTLTVLTDELREMYILCDAAKSFPDLQRATGLASIVLEEKLNRLVESGLLFEDHHLYVSLAVRLGVYLPNETVQSRMKTISGLQPSPENTLAGLAF